MGISKSTTTTSDYFEYIPTIKGVKRVRFRIFGFSTISRDSYFLHDSWLTPEQPNRGSLWHKSAPIGGTRNVIGQNFPAIANPKSSPPLTSPGTIWEVFQFFDQIGGKIGRASCRERGQS